MKSNKLVEYVRKYKVDILSILIVLSIFAVINLSFSVLIIRGNSMSPTYRDSNVVVIKKSKTVEVDDIIVFKSPESWNSRESNYIKRVIATHGDLIEVNNGIIYLNGEELNEGLYRCHSGADMKIIIPKNRHFVMGDNYLESNDSYSQYCNGNDEFLVDDSAVIAYGKELIKFGGF